ncbi:hypothetical protein SKAU_G00061110 [Synaphobranchus kaupii]|uniref:DDE Tnp4 domain-containing protein n=1 Tax=Synaphobranchus kaupii TaxID=118154 RepID=A0A9Q1G5R7_SYNKA|nr:hypothetical protein SKAU_G00061110 [Synaphobranchus kaupii]
MPLLRMYFDGGDTKRDFRLARVTLNLLIQTLEEDNTLGWGKTLEVLVFLYWLASATSYRVVSEAFAIPRQTICDIVHRVSKGIHGIMAQVICFPTGQDLGEAESQDYLNRKLFYSVQMQAICDHRGTFLNLFTSYPGSVHDARVLRLSDVYVHRQYPPQGWFLIGDGGYPCIQDPITLITPYREPVQGAVHVTMHSCQRPGV